MSDLAALETLFETGFEEQFPLPPPLGHLYGPLRFPHPPGRPYIFANFVSTLDGVVSLNEPGKSGGGEISGFNRPDQMVMGLLRAVSDVVLAGASELREPPGHIWTPDFIFPAFSEQYKRLRESLGKPPNPLNVVVTGSGKVDLTLPLFRSEQVPVLVLTTRDGAGLLTRHEIPTSIKILALPGETYLRPQDILAAIIQDSKAERILVEGGPHLLAGFFAERLLDELFLTLSPQIAGRDGKTFRPGLVEGIKFAPGTPLWGELVGVKRGDQHLFLRYRF